jgi:hypothetical protein
VWALSTSLATLKRAGCLQQLDAEVSVYRPEEENIYSFTFSFPRIHHPELQEVTPILFQAIHLCPILIIKKGFILWAGR